MRSALFFAGAALLGFAGCARFTTLQGVESQWSGPDAPVFEPGRTTQSEVLAALGPPSQIIALNGGTVLYYLRERGEGSAMVFLVYNEAKLRVTYDRAVFFFNADGVLTDFSTSPEGAPPKDN